MIKNKRTILIVEDEPVNRKILTKFLEDQYEIAEASNGADAWDILSVRYAEFSAVLLDLRMPVMDGYAVLAKMQEAKIEELPVIVITSAVDDKSEQQALNKGAWDFITKPFNPQILLTRLNNAVARSQLAGFERLQYLSEHDELTGLYSRSKMFAETNLLFQKHADEEFLFIRVDIDHFSLFNTSFGEGEGNKLLKFLADKIESIAGTCQYSVCGRMNADVFCICASYDDDVSVLDSKVEELQAAVLAYREDYRLEISVGVCRMEDRTLGADDYYLRANMASQKCKDRYDQHLAYYDETSVQRLTEELAITAEMQKALDEEQFVVYLQPKFDLTVERACGAEALIRWLHPEKGLVSPGVFIPVFERNGFISKLDYYVWKKTCALLKKWLGMGIQPYPVSVNISRISLYNPQLPELLKGLVKEFEIPPYLLQLEITESAYMTNPGLMKETIAALHEAGFTILMDDFGSGYSSLNTLKEIDMDVLKVDMKFLPIGEEVGRAEIILSSVIKMANWLGMHVVVEGVETRQQRDFLEGAGCDCVQGFFYSRPIPAAEYEEKYIDSLVGEENGRTSESSADCAAPRHNLTILVIDDNEFDRAVLLENFKMFYHIQMCESAEEALAYLRHNKNKVRLMLVDNVMPGMSGMEFLRYCREDEDLNAIPKIMITANDTVADQVEAFHEGAYDYITKPFQKEIVVARVKHVMEVICNTTLYD
ncbi:MAG: EAL domain-containing protein [bacterium]|nr:EAL domain-containing protein [bacterium]